ncbi:MAG: VWA domain-containing protein [Chloroflexi bacterium]|nr:VWA domain-containing protein [Chloroflexota bacterium]
MSRNLQSLISLFVVLIIALAIPLPALADGIIIIDPPICQGGLPCPTPPRPCRVAPCPPFPIADQLEIKYHRVTVSIENQVAITKVDQVFYNPNTYEAQGTYIFPIPKDAAVNNFTMYVDGQKISAKILDANEAKRIYQDIVAKRRDPALLEYIGQGAVQASVFPIPPKGERRIQLEYSQVLAADNGLVRYVYPLSTEKYSAKPLDNVSINVSVISKEAVRSVYSPSHAINVNRRDTFRFDAGYEESKVKPDKDFQLYYSVSPSDIGVNLLSYRDPAGGDGFFLLLASPGIDAKTDSVISKDVILVLDQSGSMQGQKISQAKDALTYVLKNLNREDRFNIVAFSTGTQRYANEMQPVSKTGDASSWVNLIRAEGGTNIDQALLEAMNMVKNNERPAIVIFLTDGLPTSGVTNANQILNDVKNAAPKNVRLFTFGVGDDVNTVLLDSLAQDIRGTSAYVRPNERIDEIVSSFYAKVSTPVLADLKIDYGSIVVNDSYPTPLPDLFAGSQLVLVGRYRSGGNTAITLRGTVNGQPREIKFEDATFTPSGGYDFIPRLWATRKIGYLLSQIRLRGENREMVQEIIALSVRYGIVTPYTSYLITEDNILTSSGQTKAAEKESNRLQAAPAAVSGAGAVQTSKDQSGMTQADQAAAPAQQYAQALKQQGIRTFIVQNNVWTDTQFDPSKMKTTQVKFASDDYFKLIAAIPDLAQAFSVSERVIAVSNGVAYEVVQGDVPPITISTVMPSSTPSPRSTSIAAATLAPATAPKPSVTPGPSPTRSNFIIPESTPTPDTRSASDYLLWGFGLFVLAIGLLPVIWWVWKKK